MMAMAFKDEYLDDFPDPQERRLKTPLVNEFYLRRDFSDYEGFITSERLEGIAIWQYFEKGSERPFWRIFTSGAIWPALKVGLGRLRKIKSHDKKFERKHEELVRGRHWYLWVLAVAPKHQGKGFASQLLRGMLPRIDREGLPVYLETEGEKNVAIYKHFGFKVIEEFSVPGEKSKQTAMLREPQAEKSKSTGSVLK